MDGASVFTFRLFQRVFEGRNDSCGDFLGVIIQWFRKDELVCVCVCLPWRRGAVGADLDPNQVFPLRLGIWKGRSEPGALLEGATTARDGCLLVWTAVGVKLTVFF